MDFISKTFHAEEVLARVDTHLRLSRLTRNLANEVDKQTSKLIEEQRFRELLDYAVSTAAEAIALIGADGRYLYVNETGCRYMNRSREEMLNLSVSDIDPNYPQDVWLAHFEELKNSGGQRLQTAIRDADGQEHLLEIHSQYYEKDGEEFIWSFAWDVTERERLNRKLSEYKHMLESFGNPVALVDREFNYLYVNRPYADVFGQTQEGILGRSVPELLGEETFATKIKEHYLSCFAGESINYQSLLNLPDQPKRFYDIRYYPVADSDGNIIAAVSNINDISELVETQNALNES